MLAHTALTLYVYMSMHLLYILQSTDTLSVGPFSISPTEFHLSAGSSMTFMVQFKPSGVGKYSEDFIMACDNGQVLSFTLKGTYDFQASC